MEPMPSVFDVIVIGAGIEGSSCAYNLVKSGKSVLLLEQFPLAHTRGSSHGQSRITRYAYPVEVYVRMMRDAFPMWATLEQEAGEKFFVNCGVLGLRREGGATDRVVSFLSAHNVPHERLTGEATTGRFPHLSSLAATDEAVFDPSGGVLRADRAIAAFQRVLKQLGGVIKDSEPVLTVKPGPTAKVVTSRSEYTATSVVIAAGPWSGFFSSALGLQLPITPVRVTSLYWRIKPGLESAHHWSNFPCIVDSRTYLYCVPCLEYPGLMKVSYHGGVPCDPNLRDQFTEDDALVERATIDLVKATFSGLETTPAIREMCIYTETPDNHPIIDHHPRHHNILFAAGFSGHGFKLAPAIGKLISEMVTGKDPTYDTALFRIGRFNQQAKL